MIAPRHILIACDKFKGSLDAATACAAIARGLAARFPRAVIECRPIADGGEGFAASLMVALSGRWVEAPAHDALGREITARYLLADTAEGPLAVIEMAAACGMWRIAAEERDVLRASTRGAGELMRHAVLESGAAHLVVGLGGSATNDGGAGMAAALGVRFLTSGGVLENPTPATLSGRLVEIDTGPRIPLPRVTAACDVASPLSGPQGATRVFGPQKGAGPAEIPVLEDVLETLVHLSGGRAHALTPGAGAAGGLGFGLLRFADAELTPGFELTAALTGLANRVAVADLIITGEGSLDAQSLLGKGPAALARLARKHGKPVIAFCGTADDTARHCGLFDSVIDLAATGLPLERLLTEAGDLLENGARHLPG